jgi:uroporphyrinogen decarboxylase
MTHRERMRAVLNHKEADKIAVDCGGMHSSGLSGMTYNAVKRHLGITGGATKIYDVNQQLAVPEQWYLDRFQIDTVDLARVFDAEGDWQDWKLPDNTPAKLPGWMTFEQRGNDWFVLNGLGEVLARMPEGAFYFDQEIYPYYGQDKESFEDLKESLAKISWTEFKDQMWKSSDRPDFYESVGRAVRKLYAETDYSIIVNYSSLFFEPGQWLYRNDEFFMKLLTEPAEITALFEQLLEMHLQRLKPYLEQVDGYADVIIFSDDLGMQSGPLISSDLYAKMIKPYHQKVFRFVKEHSSLKTFLHSCGSIVDIIPHLIDAGLDILNPVQIQTKDMEAHKLKARFGKDLVFWGGGIDTQHTLGSSSAAQVRDEVRRNAEIFMKDGGFVFTAIHNMLPGIPPENIVAMYDEVNALRY